MYNEEGVEEYKHTETRNEAFEGETLYRYTRFIEGYKTDDEIAIVEDTCAYTLATPIE